MGALQPIGSRLAVGAGIKQILAYCRQSEGSLLTTPAYLNKQATVYCTHTFYPGAMITQASFLTADGIIRKFLLWIRTESLEGIIAL